MLPDDLVGAGERRCRSDFSAVAREERTVAYKQRARTGLGDCCEDIGP
jgi:hypothetical protein